MRRRWVWQEPGVCAVRGNWAELVLALNDGHRYWNKCCLGEGDGQADAPLMNRDVLAEQAGVGVLSDAEEAIEGKQRWHTSRARQRRRGG